MKRRKFFCFFIVAFELIAMIGLISTLAHSFQSTSITGLVQKYTQKMNNTQMIDVPFIAQTKDYPTGCEAVSAVMALHYFGIELSAEDFIDNYLDLGIAPYESDGVFYGDSPWNCFLGSPYEESGWGCYSPVIRRALDAVLNGSGYEAEQSLNKTMQALCSEYIDNGTPVIIWATMEMREAAYTSSWVTPEGEEVTWIAPEHCLLLVGYDDTYFYFNDPRQHKQTAYFKQDAEKAYESMLSQAVIIRPEE